MSRTRLRSFVVFGPPGGGKGTFFEYLRRFLGNVLQLSSSACIDALELDLPAEQLRDLTSWHDCEDSKAARAKGLLLADSYVQFAIEWWLERQPLEDYTAIGWDGFPRTPAQVGVYLAILAKFDMVHTVTLVLSVTRELATARIIGRAKEMQKARKTPRPDDLDPVTIGTRLDVYEAARDAVLQLLEPHGRIVRIEIDSSTRKCDVAMAGIRGLCSDDPRFATIPIDVALNAIVELSIAD